MSSPTIKIIVAYHRASEPLEGEDFLCVNAGSAVARDIPDMTGDDTGDNISRKNESYNELTAVYWAWKNLDADYFGLMHYRRHFMFCGGKKKYYSRRHQGRDYNKRIGYSPERLREILSEYDFIAPKPVSESSVYEHYARAHDSEDLDEAVRVIDTLYTEYSDAAGRYLAGGDAYFGNMFVFDRETFDRYCTFVFGVLERLEERFVGKRMYVSERLTGIFITQLISEGKRGDFLPVMQIEVKRGLKNALIETKRNFSERKKRGIKGFVYACKPLLEELAPRYILTKYRNRR